MEITILTFFVALLLGTVITDWRDRKRLEAQVKAAHSDLEEAAKKLADLHNSLALGMQDMQDRVSTLEFKSGRAPGSTPWTQKHPQPAATP